MEDVQRLAKLIAAGLGKHGFEADCAGTAADAHDLLEERIYDAIVLDLGLPDADGVEFLKELRSEQVQTPTLILTARVTLSDRILGLDSGADDYLVKPFEMDELAARLRAIIRRPPTVASEVLELGNLRMATASREVEVDGTQLHLTRRETTLLEYLMQGAGRVIQKLTLEDQIFGSNLNSANALEVLVHRLRQKLRGAEAKVNLHTVRGVGYVLADEDETS